MLNLIKAIITLLGGFSAILALFITVFLVIYLGYLVLFILSIVGLVLLIKNLYDTGVLPFKHFTV